MVLSILPHTYLSCFSSLPPTTVYHACDLTADFIKGDHFTCFPSLGNVTLAIFLCCMLTALQWLHFKPLYGILILFLGILPALLWPFIWKRCCEVGGFCWCEDEDTQELVCLCQNCADSEDE